MKIRILGSLIIAAIILPTCPKTARAQDQDQSKEAPLTLGGFETQGSVTAGFRFTDFTGREEKFLELFDMQQGFRVYDFNLFGRAKEGTLPFADSYSLTTSGLGGDPFPAAQFTLRKSKVYDLRVNYRQTYYYWNRNDGVVPPAPAGLPSFHNLTSNHDWATVRRFGSANLLIHATNNLRFSFEVNRNSRDGVNFTTRVMDYFGAPAIWGSFTRANPYYVEAPLNELSNRVTGGLSYSRRDWDFHYRVGYQTFEQSTVWNNVDSPQQSINVDSPPTASELLDSASWSDFRRLKTPVSEFSYTGRLRRRLDLRGGYIFYRYRGPASMTAAFNGTARTNSAGTTFTTYDVSESARSSLSEPAHVIDQGFSYRLKDWWNVHADYRYYRFTTDSFANFHSLALYNFNGLSPNPVPFDEVANNVWRAGTHQLDFNLEFAPSTKLVVRPGVRLLKRDILGLVDGVADPVHSRRIKTAWPLASVYYQPSKRFSVRADVQSITSGASYTRISPHTDVGSRAIFRFRPTDKLTVEDNLVIRDRKFRDANFDNTFRSNGAAISYAFNDKLSTFGGFSYDSFFATASVTFIRGVPPLTATWRDQTVNRVWQAGIAAKPLPRFGFNFSGDYVRSTGAGEISGEPPYFGPMTFPMGTATVYYDFPKAGRLSVDFMRTYYFEQIVQGNDFHANLLAIRWTRDF